MALTLEDHDRRLASLEVAQSATDDALARLDRKVDRLTARVDALHHVTAELIAESERRLHTQISTSIDASEKRTREEVHTVVGDAKRSLTDLLNDRFDAIMVALDRQHNPPR
jgi:hypothetical protein